MYCCHTVDLSPVNNRLLGGLPNDTKIEFSSIYCDICGTNHQIVYIIL